MANKENMEKLIKKIRRGEVILWAGAGFSYYTSLPTGNELANKIVEEMPAEYREEFENKSLPEVSEEFVQMNHGSKTELMRILDENINIEHENIEYHKKLTEIPQIKKIVTTNYDDLFEKAYGKRDISVIIKNSQVPLANKRVSLYKIHGDINDPESIVLTKSDYNNFFSSPNNEAVWSKIKTLMDEASILFVGYSLEDSNAQMMLDGLIEKIGDFRHESFLVTPRLRSYKQKALEKKGISYIDMTAQQLINEIHQEVMNNLIKDCEGGFLDIRETNELLKKKGINPKFEFEDGNFKLKSYGAEEPIPLKLNLEESAWSEINQFLFEDIEREELEISQELIKGINSSYNGINLYNHEKIGELKIIKYPNNEMDGSFSLRGTNFILENIKCKSFSSNTEASIQFRHQSFSLRIKIDFNSRENQKIHLAVKPSGDVLLDYKGLYFLKEWLTQGHELIFNNMTDKNMIPIGDLKSNTIEFNELKRLQKKIINSVNFCEKLIQIQEHYEVYLTVPESVQKEDVEKVQKILFAINREKKRISSYKTTFMPYTNIEEIIGSEEKFSFKIIDHNPHEEELFGQVFTLGYPCLETVDGILEDRDKVFLDIKSGKEEVKAVFKSASNEMYFSYQPELPVS
ncbi:SIR2 family NAD-dependent protein deacylase [Bacillus cereus group sp. MYBK57-1]|uniref:SIR2 family NAD-dependent protein deacylase n=1 Tax=Bacillus cereus group sp. MYBK57-1 TaxID=3450619 RepID=UPI003F7A301A